VHFAVQRGGSGHPGHKFFGDLIVLPSNGIDVILGIDWITTHKGFISTSPRLVTLVHPDGTSVTFEPMKSRDIPAVYSLHTRAISNVPVVCEFDDMFPEELPVCHQTVTWSL
jgi:hypothetical protein